MSDTYYSTGQFAKLCGVKKQTLFHYDHIGLMKPAFVDEKGFRLYAPEQYQDFLMISCLKETGMELSQIREWLADEGGNSREEALRSCIERLDARIARLERVRQVLSSGFEHVPEESAPSSPSDRDTTLRVLEEYRGWVSPRLDELNDAQMVEVVSRIIKAAPARAVCLPTDKVLAGDLGTQRYLFVDGSTLNEEQAEAAGLVPYTIPEGKYAQIELYPDDDAQAVYSRLIEDIGLIFCRPGELFYEMLPAADAPASPTLVTVEIFPIDDEEQQ